MNENYNENYNENSSEMVNETTLSLSTQTEENTISATKHNKTKTKKSGFVHYIVFGLICSMLGGVVSAGATMYFYPQLNPNVVSNNSINNTTPKSTTSSATSTNYIPLSVSNIAQQVGPAVVGVSTTSSSAFDGFGFPNQGGFGSGIIFSEEGYILTNYHVVAGAKEINVIFNTTSDSDNEKTQHAAKIVNYNEELDVAVIKLEDNVTVPAVAQFGDSSNLLVGDPVVAIGNPLGEEFLGTITSGIVSALDREVTDENSKTQKYIQTDAAINAGNSGGALVNIYGQVIGINSAKIGGTNVEGLGFAIPINDIEPLLEDLLKPIITLGISVREITEEMSKKYNYPVGIYVHEVSEFSAAEVAGLKNGDVIVGFDGKDIKTLDELNKIKQSHAIGDDIEIKVSRDGEIKTLTLKLK
ncbi:S1C family serine protease [Clostridium grantii]|uniref:Serine protease Do n=1 Tax=Clostridium grantii DSM 8605 TaxID=1121316 RepID=A0A1M5RMI9_9CLOT|nr:trypsin-like peptidase domain-containing protein [Clostridium grantii]SHH27534.1 serine protease Do [Clostridium grantii DSM 8605]